MQKQVYSQPTPLITRARRAAAGRRALALARTRADQTSPLRHIEQLVEVDVIVAGGRIATRTPRLRLECGHVVDMPGRSMQFFHSPPRVGDQRRCAACRSRAAANGVSDQHPSDVMLRWPRPLTVFAEADRGHC